MECEPPDVLASDPAAGPAALDKELRGGLRAESEVGAGIGTSTARTRSEAWIERLTLPRLLIALTVVSLVLRGFYTGYLYQDDGLWFTAAEQLLRGKVLYREIYFDKPPLLPIAYALLFRVFGAHILVIRLFTVVFVTAVSGVLYFFGSHLYDRKTGILAAALFTFFSTTGVSGHVQGFDSDFLMVLPYTIGACLLTASAGARGSETDPKSSGRQAWLALAGGALTGVAVQTNPKGIFDLAFFALLLIVQVMLCRGAFSGRWKTAAEKSRLQPITAAVLLALAAAGALAGSLPFLAYLAATHSFSNYVAYVWDWGFRYARYFTLIRSLATGLRVVLSYLALNSLLAVALGFFLTRIAKRAGHARDLRGAPGQAYPDLALFVWLACSAAAMAVGGRFYAHYSFEILPALCLVGARGLIHIKQRAGPFAASVRHRYGRRAIAVLLALGFLITVVRFHTRTAVLAIDWVRGSKSESTDRWYHEILNREERMAAGIVSELPGGAEEAMNLPPETIREFHLSATLTEDKPDYLFVWGYRPEVYYWSGLIPASRFLSIQAVTGIPADVQYINGNSRSVISDSDRQVALDQLLTDLEQTRPKYIVDEAGMFNSALLITSYPGICDFMRGYKQVEATGNLMVYRKRDPDKKNRNRNESAGKGA